MPETNDDAERLARLERDWSFLSGIGEASKDDAQWIEQLREFTKPLPETEPSRNPYQQAMAARSLRLLDSRDAALREAKQDITRLETTVSQYERLCAIENRYGISGDAAELVTALREARDELDRLRSALGNLAALVAERAGRGTWLTGKIEQALDKAGDVLARPQSATPLARVPTYKYPNARVAAASAFDEDIGSSEP